MRQPRRRLLALGAAAVAPRVRAFSAVAPPRPPPPAKASTPAAPIPRPPDAPPMPAVPPVLDVGLPSPLPPSLFDDLNERGVAVVPNYATPDQCALLRFDMLRLRSGGHTARAGTEGDRGSRNAANGGGETTAPSAGAAAAAAAVGGTRPPASLRECEHYWLVDRPGAAREVERESRDEAAGTTLQRDLPVERRERRDRYVGPRYVGDLVSTLEYELDGTDPFFRAARRGASGGRRTSSSLSPSGEVGAGGRTEEHQIHVHETEAAYLYYDTGGYYNWHLDTPSRERLGLDAGSTVATEDEQRRRGRHRRAFSFLLYLGDGAEEEDRRPWEMDDGGCLRVYPPLSLEDQRTRVDGPVLMDPSSSFGGPVGGGSYLDELSSPPRGDDGEGLRAIGDPEVMARTGRYRDILPEEGTFVLFKSEAVPHEALPTRRERMAVVGWIHGNLH